MTKEWVEYNIYTEYPNLNEIKNPEGVVDIMLHTGEIIFMCILKTGFEFWCIDKRGGVIPRKEVAKIRLTHKEVKVHKKHHWGRFGIGYCLRCNKIRTIPVPKECDIIWYSHYRTADPNYQPNKKPIQPFAKNQEGYFIPPL